MNQVTNEFCSLFSEEFSEDYFYYTCFVIYGKKWFEIKSKFKVSRDELQLVLRDLRDENSPSGLSSVKDFTETGSKHWGSIIYIEKTYYSS